MAEDPEVVGEAFNFSTETPLTVLELVAALQRAAGTDLEPEILATATHEIDSQFLSAAKARKVLDRKRVVSGKSVSVRVAIGGRRLIKNKTKHHSATN